MAELAAGMIGARIPSGVGHGEGYFAHRVLAAFAGLLMIAGLAALFVPARPGAPSLANAWRVNRHALETAKELIEQPGTERAAGVIAAACPDYPTGLRALYQPSLSPVETLQRVEQLAACWPPERAALLTGWRATALWELGRHREICAELAAVGAAPRMLSLAEKSSAADDWTAVAVYLDCLPKLAPGDAWISPWIVAKLYFGLGQHLEEAQAVDAAIDAFDAAAFWYPTVWAAPYQAEAQLLWQQGNQEQAVRLLVDAVSRSTDQTASFQLWRQLGLFWAQIDNGLDALCAYQKAAALVDRLPAGNVSDSGRRALMADLDALRESVIPAACFANYPVLNAP
jgi:tetratricopeptide (TPR) repeat protein